MKKHWVVRAPEGYFEGYPEYSRLAGDRFAEVRAYAKKNRVSIAASFAVSGNLRSSVNIDEFNDFYLRFGNLYQRFGESVAKAQDEADAAERLRKIIAEWCSAWNIPQLTNTGMAEMIEGIISFGGRRKDYDDVGPLFAKMATMIHGREFIYALRLPISARARAISGDNAQPVTFFGPRELPVDERLWPGAKPSEMWDRLASDYFHDGEYLKVSGKAAETADEVISSTLSPRLDLTHHGNVTEYFWRPKESFANEGDYIMAIKKWALRVLGSSRLTVDDIGVELD